VVRHRANVTVLSRRNAAASGAVRKTGAVGSPALVECDDMHVYTHGHFSTVLGAKRLINRRDSNTEADAPRLWPKFSRSQSRDHCGATE
jgi:hypothetical protein